MKVCASCHSTPTVGNAHSHSHSHTPYSHHRTHRSPARNQSPARSGSVSARSRPQQHQGRHYSRNDERNIEKSHGSLSLVDYNTSSEESVLRMVTRATSPIDDVTLQHLCDGRDPNWIALSGLQKDPLDEIPPRFIDPSQFPLATTDTNSLSVHSIPRNKQMDSQISHQQELTPMTQRMKASPGYISPGYISNQKEADITRHNISYMKAEGEIPAGDISVPRFRSSLEHSRFEAPDPNSGVEQMYKV